MLTKVAPSEEAIAGLCLSELVLFDESTDQSVDLPWLQEKFRSYWGVEKSSITQVANISASFDADAVVVVGLDVLPYLAAVKDAKRIWYAADEWVLHHLSQFRLSSPASWSEIKPAIIKGVYEFAYARSVDCVWVVSDADKRATQTVMRKTDTRVIPNGIDTAHFLPIEAPRIPFSCTFWGRLDFGPNIDALKWFAPKVWRELKRSIPEAQLEVFGFSPTDEIMALAEEFNFRITANLPDLRSKIARHQVVVLPFVSGAGIKNKFLEAASMGKPIIVSGHGLNGIDLPKEEVVRVARTPKQWIEQLRDLWQNEEAALQTGQRAREWVARDYSWPHAATLAVESVSSLSSTVVRPTQISRQTKP